ncbi:MAG TPA: hypothetical protein VF240_21025 [Pyrinomonadaceae bacterium]
MRALKNTLGCFCLSVLFTSACLGQAESAPAPASVAGGAKLAIKCLGAGVKAGERVALPGVHREGEQSFDLIVCYLVETEEDRRRGDLLIEFVIHGSDAAPVRLKRPAIKVGEELLCRTDRSAYQSESAAGNVTDAVVAQTLTAHDFEQLFTGKPVTVQFGRVAFELTQGHLDALRKLLKSGQ